MAAIRTPQLRRMLTTGLTQADDPAARATFAAARAAGVTRLKAGYYRYAFADARRELAAATTSFHALVAMAAQSGVMCAYHNHSGDYVGAPMWDVLRMLEGQPADATGFYFDVRHATVEGGLGGWRAARADGGAHMRMLAIRFSWEKGAKGAGCRRLSGGGMVDGGSERRAQGVFRDDVDAWSTPWRPTTVEKTEGCWPRRAGFEARAVDASVHRRTQPRGRRRRARSALLLGLGAASSNCQPRGRGAMAARAGRGDGDLYLRTATGGPRAAAEGAERWLAAHVNGPPVRDGAVAVRRKSSRARASDQQCAKSR